MASQPLESIPEEPTPAPAPARVTADPPKTKPKNPGRVESGKRLAERNRLAREAKKKEQAEAAIASASKTTAATPATASDNNNNNSSLSVGALLGIGGLIVSLLGVYYQREAIMARLKPAQAPAPAPAPDPKPSRIPVKQRIKKME